MKQVCVVGLGQFGSHLARTLAALGCEVLAIDAEEQPVAAIRDDVQRAVIADVRDFESLNSLVTPEMDEAIVGLGESLEASILCTLHLHRIGVKRILAKASGKDHASILKAIGATEIIFPERDTAERMAQRILNPDLLDYLPLSREYRVVELEVPAGFRNQSLVDLHLRKRFQVMVLAIKHPATGRLEFLPPAESILREGNTLVAIGKEADLDKLRGAE